MSHFKRLPTLLKTHAKIYSLISPDKANEADRKSDARTTKTNDN